MMRAIKSLALSAVLLASGCADPVIGMRCVQGYVPCEGQCVLVEEDPRNCGGCGVACGADQVCGGGVCMGGAPGDAAIGAAEASVPDAGVHVLVDASMVGEVDGGAVDGGAVDGDVDGSAVDGDVEDGSIVIGDRDGDIEVDGGVSGDVDGGAMSFIDGGAMSFADGSSSFADGSSSFADGSSSFADGSSSFADGSPSSADGGRFDGGVADAAGRDGALGASDGGSSEDGAVLCELGQTRCEGSCVDVRSDVENCGVCGHACAASEVCSAGRCAATCDDGLEMCGAICIDTATDPDNCGGCGVRCSAGFCADGACEAALAGHIVLIGHDYAVSRGAMDRVLRNAVQLATSSRPLVAILREAGTSTESFDGALAALSPIASSLATFTLRAEELTQSLAEANVLLVPALSSGTDELIFDWGHDASRAFAGFFERGGVVIVLEGPAPHRGTYQFLEGAGLFHADARALLPIEGVTIVSPTDALAIGVPLTYRAERSTSYFVGTSTHVVVESELGPVVLHDTVGGNTSP